jgi:hypothetical protein
MNRTPSTSSQTTLLKVVQAPTDNSLVYSDVLDCVQYDGGHAAFLIVSGPTGAAADIDSLAVYESTATGGSYTAVTGADFTAITSANDGTLLLGSCQLRARKRFLKIGYNPGGSNDAAFVVIAQLTGASESKQNADTYDFEL